MALRAPPQGYSEREGNGEPGANHGEEPGLRSTFWGHSLTTSVRDPGLRTYLNGLDREEIEPIFDYARIHGQAELEARGRDGVRDNYSIEYKSGKYTGKDQGKQKISNKSAK